MKDAQLAKHVAKLDELRARKKRLEEKIQEEQDIVLQEMERRDALGLILQGMKVTYTQAERVIYLVPKLKKRLGPALFKKITTSVVDKSKLEELVLAGEIDVDLVAECSEVKKNRPFVSISEVE